MITYNSERLQLGAYEKESWLWRALRGRSIVFSSDIAPKLTAMTRGDDVARGIAAVIGKEAALSRTFHITCPKSHTWQEILDCYTRALKERGVEARVVMTKKCLKLKMPDARAQVLFSRYFNRSFDNSSISEFIDIESFSDPLSEAGLSRSLDEFLRAPAFFEVSAPLEGLADKAAHERAPLSDFSGRGAKALYLAFRYLPSWAAVLLLKAGRLALRARRLVPHG